MTGTLVENGPSNPYRVTDREVLDLSWRMGKTIERVAVDTWTEKITVPPFWKDVISNEAENVRSQLSKLTQKTIWDNNVTVSEYQKLTLPPQIPFLAEDRHLPSEKPLRVLFKTIDHFFDANLLREFAKLSSEFPGSEKIDKRIKQLTESALIIERVISERFPLKFADYKIWPDVRIKNTLQFDAILEVNILPGIIMDLTEDSNHDL